MPTSPPLDSLEVFKQWLAELCDAHELAIDEGEIRHGCGWCLYDAFLALARDRERLEWLNGHVEDDGQSFLPGSGWRLLGPASRPWDLRAAIDAAMTADAPAGRGAGAKHGMDGGEQVIEERYDSDGLLSGYTLDAVQRESLHKRLGRELPDEVYEQQITGHYVLVAPEPVSEKSGMLYKPRSAVERQQLAMGAGWVVSAGPLAGSAGNVVHPVGVIVEHPSKLLGLHVLYKSYQGTTIRISEEDMEDEFRGILVTMTDRDLFAVSRRGML